MFITIYSLNADYMKCAVEMGGAIEIHEVGNVIDVEFNTESDGIELDLSQHGVVSITSKHGLGMVLNADEFLSIKLS